MWRVFQLENLALKIFSFTLFFSVSAPDEEKRMMDSWRVYHGDQGVYYWLKKAQNSN